MSNTTMHTFITFLGVMLMSHITHMALQYRLYLRKTGQEFTTLPIDILIKGIISLFIVMHCIIYIAGDFKEIRS